MKITCVGSGSAFTEPKENSSFFLEFDDTNLLFDCGYTVPSKLAEIGKTYKDIENLYISHNHADHIGGIEELAFKSYFDSKKDKINLYCEIEVLEDLEGILEPSIGYANDGPKKLKDFFHIKVVNPENQYFKIGNTSFDLIKTKHIKGMPSYGLSINLEGKGDGNKNVFITADSVDTYTDFKSVYENADYIFQDCEIGFKSGVHAYFDDLNDLPQEIKDKMHVYHYKHELDFPKNTFKQVCKFKDVWEI